MDKFTLQERTQKFHIAVIQLCETLPKNAAAYEIAKQLIRSAGSVGANYRAACRAKSRPDFIYKIKVVLEEADESLYWLEILIATRIVASAMANTLIKEAKELVLIFNATAKTAKDNLSKSKNP
ncbi:four helix bundle protein [Chitinophaga eiseniae]|uniref:Four helix bundle protein n=1 Tax=Chitinophaga eiseniae TaxID=634771 RepID=A0A1T4LJP9_9BACT|nr:four helix bundle protein [Chitinophaga eiseniae]SJZ54836.1 four helix bundle protein [Chitinophaga eiseniae]